MRIFFGVILAALIVYLAGFLIFLARLPATPATARADGIVALTGGGARLDTAVALLEPSGPGRFVHENAGLLALART